MIKLNFVFFSIKIIFVPALCQTPTRRTIHEPKTVASQIRNINLRYKLCDTRDKRHGDILLLGHSYKRDDWAQNMTTLTLVKKLISTVHLSHKISFCLFLKQ